jgi:hypothetical protein
MPQPVGRFGVPDQSAATVRKNLRVHNYTDREGDQLVAPIGTKIGLGMVAVIVGWTAVRAHRGDGRAR